MGRLPMPASPSVAFRYSGWQQLRGSVHRPAVPLDDFVAAMVDEVARAWEARPGSWQSRCHPDPERRGGRQEARRSNAGIRKRATGEVTTWPAERAGFGHRDSTSAVTRRTTSCWRSPSTYRSAQRPIRYAELARTLAQVGESTRPLTCGRRCWTCAGQGDGARSCRCRHPAASVRSSPTRSSTWPRRCSGWLQPDGGKTSAGVTEQPVYKGFRLPGSDGLALSTPGSDQSRQRNHAVARSRPRSGDGLRRRFGWVEPEPVLWG